jgi:murein DD-endopeptidase MepM/ murein hydrolase activator NlpD
VSKKLTLMLIPEGSEKVFSRTVSSTVFKVFIVLISVWVIFLIGVTILYSRLSMQALRSASLQRDNQRLQQYYARVVDIENSFKKNQELTARLAEMAGVKLEDLNSPAKINLDSMRTAYSAALDSDGIHDSSIARTNLTPEQLRQQRIPGGRPLYGWVTKSFQSDDNKDGERHPGIDFAVKEGTNVSATAAGIVISAGWDDNLGNLVVIDHENGYITMYGHNQKILVKKGDRILKGDIVALSGNTGHSTAPHLHYEIVKDNRPIDPTPFLD